MLQIIENDSEGVLDVKVLWLVNIPTQEASELMNDTPSPFGGWFNSTSKLVAESDDIELSIAFPKPKLNNVRTFSGQRIRYFAFPAPQRPSGKERKDNVSLARILEEANPDLVHIFGTEFPQSNTMARLCKEKLVRCVIQIQGLVSVIAKHYSAGLSERVQRRSTFRNIVLRDNIKQQQKLFASRGKLEIEALRSVKHIIGHTTWDKACSEQINPEAIYYHCNETLRGEFYNHQWSLDNCEKHSIFVSQAQYPVKGLHHVLEALGIVLKRFPDARLYVAGKDRTRNRSLRERLEMSYYGKYLVKKIREYGLADNVRFTGILDEKQMCQQYLKANVFVSASSIENESNSLSEAKILGVPCVASYVGGVTDRLTDKQDGFFYQFDAPYMLAHYICEVFGDDRLAARFSANARRHALEIHDRYRNLSRLLEIYSEIYMCKS